MHRNIRPGRGCLPATNIVLLLLCLMYLLTYIDRVNVSTASNVFEKELNLNKTEVGFIFSVFAYPYLIFQIIGGYRLRQQTFTLSSFLQSQVPGYEPPKLLGKKVLLHGHCHHRAVLSFTHEETLIKRMGVELKSLDSGCCGMAGPFGFEKSKFKVSQALGERVLLPAVRDADPSTLVVTDGFSCREQVEQNTGRRPLHIAELLRLGVVG